MNFKYTWNRIKFDIYWALLCICFWTILFASYNMTAFEWQYWVLIVICVSFRFIGYKEGQCKIFRDLAERTIKLTIHVDNDKEIKAIKCKLSDIPAGLYFTLCDDNNKYTYLKCNDYDEQNTACWNTDTDELHILENNSECIAYKTNIIHVPIVKLKEKK